MDQVFANTY